MKKIAIAASMMMLGAGGAFAADPAVGLWKTEPGDTGGYLHVQISECGSNICGTIKEAISADGSKGSQNGYEHLGKRMLWDMKSKGNGAYAGGKVWAADRDKTYKSKMQLNGNKLTVKGCVGPICRGQDWTRLN